MYKTFGMQNRVSIASYAETGGTQISAHQLLLRLRYTVTQAMSAMLPIRNCYTYIQGPNRCISKFAK